MAKRIEFFVGDSLDVYENIAFEYGLLKSCPDDALRIFLWSNDRTVVIGKNQNAFSEVNLDALKSIDGRLARRTYRGRRGLSRQEQSQFYFCGKRGRLRRKKTVVRYCPLSRKMGYTRRGERQKRYSRGGQKIFRQRVFAGKRLRTPSRHRADKHGYRSHDACSQRGQGQARLQGGKIRFGAGAQPFRVERKYRKTRAYRGNQERGRRKFTACPRRRLRRRSTRKMRA